MPRRREAVLKNNDFATKYKFSKRNKTKNDNGCFSFDASKLNTLALFLQLLIDTIRYNKKNYI